MCAARGSSSAGGGRFDLAPILALPGEVARFEDVRRKAGDRGETVSRVACKELSDVRLRTVGVVGRSLLLSELELGALRTGGLPVAVPSTSDASMDGAIGDDGGKAVATAVDIKLSDRVALFID